MRTLFFLLVMLVLSTSLQKKAQAQNLKAVQIYTSNQLFDLIKDNKHLGQVVLDDCQLVQDIEARANKAQIPAYQYLWGDMLAFGVCVKKDIKLGLYYMNLAADQGLSEGLEQIGRYYHLGKFMDVDIKKAITYLRTAASLNNLKAQIRLADLYEQGYGSPLDYPALYSQLHRALKDNKKLNKKVSKLLAQLASKMPEHVIIAAKKTSYTN